MYHILHFIYYIITKYVKVLTIIRKLMLFQFFNFVYADMLEVTYLTCALNILNGFTLPTLHLRTETSRLPSEITAGDLFSDVCDLLPPGLKRVRDPLIMPLHHSSSSLRCVYVLLRHLLKLYQYEQLNIAVT